METKDPEALDCKGQLGAKDEPQLDRLFCLYVILRLKMEM